MRARADNARTCITVIMPVIYVLWKRCFFPDVPLNSPAGEILRMHSRKYPRAAGRGRASALIFRIRESGTQRPRSGVNNDLEISRGRRERSGPQERGKLLTRFQLRPLTYLIARVRDEKRTRNSKYDKASGRRGTRDF